MDLYKFKYYLNLMGIYVVIGATLIFILALLTNNVTPIVLMLFSLNWIVTIFSNELFKEHVKKWIDK